MIPRAYLQEWSLVVPWPDPAQVEQDLIICRALCDLFMDDWLAERIGFRGGTAIHKLLFAKPLRYSEDIDLIQLQPGPIGKTVDAIKSALAWLGPCKREPASRSMHLTFRFAPESEPDSIRKLKIEINTREHTSVYPVRRYPFRVDSSWNSAGADIVSFEPEELFGTKLRALLQRRKNRDLFDLNEGLKQLKMDTAKLVHCFEHSLELEGLSIGRAAAEQRLIERLERSLTEDVLPLLPAGVTFTDHEAIAAVGRIWYGLVPLLRGESWKLSAETIEAVRAGRHPEFLHQDPAAS